MKLCLKKICDGNQMMICKLCKNWAQSFQKIFARKPGIKLVKIYLCLFDDDVDEDDDDVLFMVNFKLLALLFSSFFSYLDAGTISMPESLCPDDNRSMTEVNFLLDDDDEEDLELDEDDDDFLLPSSFLSEKWSRFFFLRSNRRLSSSLRLRLISLYFDLSLGILSPKIKSEKNC